MDFHIATTILILSKRFKCKNFNPPSCPEFGAKNQRYKGTLRKSTRFGDELMFKESYVSIIRSYVRATLVLI